MKSLEEVIVHNMKVKERAPDEFSIPVRNHYFYGKLLDVFHFELETDYMNAKRWLLNRMVTGWGVVCGLDVHIVEGGGALCVTSGVAVDPWGREIIVTADSPAQDLPENGWVDWDEERDEPHAERYVRERYSSPERQHDPKQEEPKEDKEPRAYHVVLCYYECKTNPAPVLAGDCDEEIACAAGTIEERYRIEIRPGHLDPISLWDCHIPDAVTRGDLNYDVLVRWVTDNCPELPNDPCVPLANLTVWQDEKGAYCEQGDVDITIRQLTLSNRALFYLLLSMLFEVTPGRRRR
jgi:hypothetical protein